MSEDDSPVSRDPSRRAPPRAHAHSQRFDRDAFSTALFTGLNVAVFRVLAASGAAAALLYSQGA